MIRPNCKKVIRFENSEFIMSIGPNCRKIWKMWIELNCRKIPTLWKMWSEPNCRKIPTILKMCARKLLWLNQILGRLYDLKRVNFLCGLDQIVGKFLQFETIEPNCRTIPAIRKERTVWNSLKIDGSFAYNLKVKQNYNMLEPNRRNIPMILKLQNWILQL